MIERIRDEWNDTWYTSVVEGFFKKNNHIVMKKYVFLCSMNCCERWLFVRFVDIDGIVDQHCIEMSVRFVDVGGFFTIIFFFF